MTGPWARRAEVEDLDQMAEVLADAFSDYAWTRWTVDERDHQERVKRLQRLVLEHVALPYGQVWIAGTGGEIGAVSVWTDSRRPPPEHVWVAMAAEQQALEGGRHEASRAAEAATRHLRPELPHLYLGAVGTRTASQRSGLGAAALRPALAAADEDQINVFLETSSEPNLRFYRRLGFDIIDEIRIDGGPPVWAMLRSPA